MRVFKEILLRAVFFGVTLSVILTAATAATSASLKLQPVTPSGVFTHSPLQVLDPSVTAYDDNDDYVPYRSDVHDNFSWHLLKQVLQEEQKNIIISPFTAKLVLALLSEAAGNNTQTQKELISTLTDIKSPDNLRGFYKKTLASLKKENPYYTLDLETKLFADAFIEPEQKYAAMLHTYYDTDIERLHFADPRTSAAAINAWCNNVTHGRLQQLVTEHNVQNNVMVIANAIYFNGLWRRQFDTSFQGVFFRTPNDQTKVDYMEQIEYFYHYDSNNLNAKILRLPYKGKKFSMFVLLPKTKAGIEELTNSLENNQLKNMQWMMEEVKVKVTLPKFKFEFNKSFKDTLNRLGISEIFTDQASLPALARGVEVTSKLKVSNVFQKSGIDVNEKGTEAFAATVVEIENKFGGSSVVEEFNVNRPFIFFIEDETTGNLIFAGKVLEPFV